MGIQFILGGSGSGKSEYLYRMITKQAMEHPNKNYLVIVPEQFTLSTQQKLVSLSPNGAIMNIDILSFKRLAYRVFDDMGMSDLAVLEETGKNLLLRRIAQEEDANLTVLKNNMSRMGYVEQLKSLISEFVQYNISPELIDQFASIGNFSRNFITKMKDVNILYTKFLEYMKDHYIMAEEILNVLCDVAKDSELLRDSVIVLDEYTGFTPIQYRLLEQLLTVTDRIYVSLSIDEREAFKPSEGMEDLFDLSKTTIRKLSEISGRQGIPVEDPVIMKSPSERRFAAVPELAHLEANLFRQDCQKYQSDQPHQAISIWNAMTPREEMIFVARQINTLVRREHYRYRDIAIVTGALEQYQIYAQEVMENYGIPYFLDSTTSVFYSPFTDCIRALIEIFDRDFNYESVMRFLRCGFSKLEEEEIDYLDNYLIATGIRRQSAWSRSWLGRKGKSKDFDLERVESMRLQLMDLWNPMILLQKQKDATLADGIHAIYQIIVAMQSADQLMQSANEYLERGLQSKAKEYEQLYEKVMQLLEKYEELLGEEPYDLQVFSELLDAGLSAIQLAAVPPGYDAITVGDIERTRLNGAKVLFFVGINEGVIPKNTNHGGIISEYERQALLDADIMLAPSAREKAFIQRFYLYRNLTKPSERLYLSFARSGSDGKALQESYLIKTVLQLFENLQVQILPSLMEEPDFSTEMVTLSYLAQGRKDDWWYAAAKALEHHEMTEQLIAAPYCSYQAQPISKNVARQLYGDVLYGSVTRIEKYFSCAYAHFLNYGLQLRERQEAGLNVMDVGDLYHMAMERFGRAVKDSGISWSMLQEEKRDELADRAMSEALVALGYEQTGEEHDADRYQLKRMREIFRRNAWVMTAQIAKGEFVPEDFEIKFGAGADNELQFALKNGRLLRVSGKIDRLDEYRKDGKIYVKIVDYKTGNTQMELSRIYHGLQLQLSVYLNAILQMKEHAVPAGILYQKITDPVLKETDDPMNDYLKELRPNGRVLAEQDVYLAMDYDLANPSYDSNVIPVGVKKDMGLKSGASVLNEEDFGILSDYAIMRMKESGDAIYEGNVAVNPYEQKATNACAYCQYRGICGFDKKIPGYQYRNIDAKRETEEWIEMMKTDINSGKDIG